MIKRTLVLAALAMTLSLLNLGCMGRVFSEGLGAATGASGRAVEVGQAANLTNFQGLIVDGIGVASGLRAPAQMPGLIQADLAAAGAKRSLSATGSPALRLSGQIIHYEDSSTTDTLIGPLEQVIVRAQLTDAGSGRVVASANLVGRAKSSSASGATNIAAGVGKALEQWLAASGLEKTASGEK